ncbi:hypothetical protein H4R18_004693 [Coemansia javaensis]|uniref:Uncharacterized protein n=1 Tax=Coemansia javaensis TaxID=2761396 RepID=A0A9W8LFE7_9FUNG|nr:hypothetical protein H4R18_004693 [Coemansia javaensis]
MSERRVQSADALLQRQQQQRSALHWQSLPNVRIGRSQAAAATAATAVQRGQYGGLYAESYDSDSASASDDNDNGCGERSMVLDCTPSVPRPAVRVGAARLSQMVRARAPAEEEEEEGPAVCEQQEASAVCADPAGPADDGDPDRGGGGPRGEDEAHGLGAAFAPLALDIAGLGAAAQEDSVLPRRLVRAGAEPAARRGGLETDDPAADGLGREPKEDGSSLEEEKVPLAGDELNGLLAAGAVADERQRARTDTRLQRLARLVGGRRRRERERREAKLFQPVVAGGSGAAAAAWGGAAGDDDNDNDNDAQWWSCWCCAARHCVAATFAAVLAGALAGFFVWPRVPTVSISSLSALASANVTYSVRESRFGLDMPVRVTYEIHSGNFYPLRIRSARVLGFDGATGNRILTAALADLPVRPLRLQFHAQRADIHYLTSDPADPALADLFGKCAPRAAAVGARPSAGRPSPLTVRFQIAVDVAGLYWIRSPIVTLNQRVECPE